MFLLRCSWTSSQLHGLLILLAILSCIYLHSPIEWCGPFPSYVIQHSEQKSCLFFFKVRMIQPWIHLVLRLYLLGNSIITIPQVIHYTSYSVNVHILASAVNVAQHGRGNLNWWLTSIGLAYKLVRGAFPWSLVDGGPSPLWAVASLGRWSWVV